MQLRRIVGVVLLLAVIGMAFPAVGEAGIAEGATAEGGGMEAQSLLARILASVQGFVAGLTNEFVAREGASITGSG